MDTLEMALTWILGTLIFINIVACVIINNIPGALGWSVAQLEWLRRVL